MCVHELIALQAARTPHHAAAEFDGRRLSYAQLEERANELACRLRERGVGVATIVGLAAEPSLEMLIGVLGILKAGGAYLPLDPHYPRRRLAYLLEDAAPSTLVTTAAAARALPQTSLPTLRLDAHADEAIHAAATKPQSGVGPANLAYVIYTSGSSGQPKGVLLEHLGLCNMAVCHAREFGVGAHSRVLQFASLCFDASVSEIFMTLISGGTLCLAPRSRLLPGHELIDLLRELRITNVLLPPSVLAVLPDAELPELETLIAGGERCTGDLVRRWAGGRNFFNAYGPTETSVTATLWRCSDADEHDPPIGTPRANARLYILDDQLRPVPAGTVGELHVGGVGLARGYLGRPELTAEKFVRDPFCEGADARMYKTGDLVRQRVDGAIEFVGRRDRQVKVRGYRIEPGEIEACLRQHPTVQQVVVNVFQTPQHHPRLAAFVVRSSDQDSNSGELRSWLRERLPPYMVPAYVTEIDSFPLTASGKIDRAALPSPFDELQAAGPGEATRTPTEAALERVWCEAFGLERIGIRDHFVELGGDSLMSVQVALRAEREGIRLKPQQLFDHPTIAELAKVLERLNRPSTGSRVVSSTGEGQIADASPESDDRRPPGFDLSLWSGLRAGDLLRLWWRNRFAIDASRLPRAASLLPIAVTNSALSLLQRILYHRDVARTEIREPPIFVIGHFRTGTTLLYELLCCDDRFAFPTSYDCFAAPHFLLTAGWVPRLLASHLPKTRPMDNMAFGFDRPQEDEFALLCLGAPSLYQRMAFPNRPAPHMETLTVEGLSAKDRRRLTTALRWFVRAQTYRKERRLVLKSPTHTGRISWLSETFPGAKFVHIVRDPFTVFASLKHSWRVLDEEQGFQQPRYESDAIDELILATFQLMYDAFDRQRPAIEAGRLCEVRYEHLVRDPVSQMQRIYQELDLRGFEEALPRLQAHVREIDGYETNRYQLHPGIKSQIERRWKNYIDTYGYGENLETTDGVA